MKPQILPSKSCDKRSVWD